MQGLQKKSDCKSKLNGSFDINTRKLLNLNLGQVFIKFNEIDFIKIRI